MLFIRVKPAPSEKKIFLWNAVGSCCGSFMSLVLLLMVTRILGPVQAGIFSIAFAISQQMWSVVNYEITTYQATDDNNHFSFAQYMGVRVVLVIAAMAIGISIGLIRQYDFYKLMCIVVLCFYKCIEGASNVFVALFQKRSRLDIYGKNMFAKTAATLVVFVASMLISDNLLTSLIILTVVYVALTVYLDGGCASQFEKIKFDFSVKPIVKILLECFPLFAGSFLLTFITNQPKYAIDDLLTSEIQTYFNILIMPASVINLLSLFILRPAIVKMSAEWNGNNITSYIKRVVNLTVYIAVITIACVGGAFLLGIPVLSFVYNVNLDGYRLDLCVILIAGGMSAVSTLIYSIIAIMRQQKYMIIVYSLTAVFSVIITKPMVNSSGMHGAVFSYLFAMTLLTAGLLIIAMVSIHNRKKSLTDAIAKENE